ncbi:MAG: NUDIX domain-containing protein [Dehalococcoidia bacterium]
MVDFDQMAGAAKRFNQSDAPVELNIGDEWRARWVEGEGLPADVPVLHVYGSLVMDDKGYVVLERGSEARWSTVEGSVAAGEKPEPALKRLAKEQANATVARVEMVGFLDCRATSHNPDYHKDSRSLRPIYLVAAKQVKDLGSGAAFERRRLPMNEYMMAIRNRYPEIDDYLPKAVERYMILRARGEL